MAKKANEIVPLQVRMRRGLLEKMQADAKRNEHSLNAEVVGRLEGSYDDERDAFDFHKVASMLVGSSDNAKLLSMIASALHLSTHHGFSKRPKDVADSEARAFFLQAVELVTLAHAGMPLRPFTFDELAQQPETTQHGYNIADVILRNNGLPGVVELPAQSMSLADLGRQYLPQK